MKNRILYFIEGACPTEEENKAAQKLKQIDGNHVSFRNASQVQPGEALERCDQVAGLVPKVYAGFPNAETGKGDPLVAIVADADRTDGHLGKVLSQDAANAEGNPTPVLSDGSPDSEVKQAADREEQDSKSARTAPQGKRPTAKFGASVGKQTKR